MLKTFSRGGIHPPENKFSAGSAIQILAIPKTVTIPVAQHIGAPATPIVNRGDMVKTGQVIAQSAGFVSANIHSTVSGKVIKIDKIVDSSGYKKTSVVIQVEGDDWVETIDRSPEIVKDVKLGQAEIIEKVLASGIVGLGGATFPSHVKLSIPKGKTVNILIINGVECEPYLTSDHRLMLEKGEEVVIGTSILMKALGVEKAIIGIENNKKDAIKHLTEIVSNYKGISVSALKVKYPQGGEKQLIESLISREVPSGALPIDVGAVVHNVGTAFAVYEAIQKNKPLIERVVTVTGKAINQTSNFMTRIGTPINELIEAAGGVPENTGKIVNGGPMMGKALNSLDAPVAKGTSGILLFPEEESQRNETKPCIRCGKCVTVCPMGLEPYFLMTLTEKRKYDRVEEEKALDCIECGSCSYVCPADRPLLDYIRLGKSNVSKMIRSRNKK